MIFWTCLVERKNRQLMYSCMSSDVDVYTCVSPNSSMFCKHTRCAIKTLGILFDLESVLNVGGILMNEKSCLCAGDLWCYAE